MVLTNSGIRNNVINIPAAAMHAHKIYPKDRVSFIA